MVAKREQLFLAADGLQTRFALPFPKSGSLGLPADFLIASDGRVLACKYGTHAFDQWSVDEILSLSGAIRSSPRLAG